MMDARVPIGDPLQRTRDIISVTSFKTQFWEEVDYVDEYEKEKEIYSPQTSCK